MQYDPAARTSKGMPHLQATLAAPLPSHMGNAGLKFRAALYEPICGAVKPTQGAAGSSARAPPALWRRLLGLAAVFAASGVAHELAHWYLTRRFSGGC